MLFVSFNATLGCGRGSAAAQGLDAAAVGGVAERPDQREVPALEVDLGERGVHRDDAARADRSSASAFVGQRAPGTLPPPLKRKGAAPDTLYQDLSSRGAVRLATEFTTWRRAQKARDSPFR